MVQQSHVFGAWLNLCASYTYLHGFCKSKVKGYAEVYLLGGGSIKDYAESGDSGGWLGWQHSRCYFYAPSLSLPFLMVNGAL